MLQNLLTFNRLCGIIINVESATQRRCGGYHSGGVVAAFLISNIARIEGRVLRQNPKEGADAESV